MTVIDSETRMARRLSNAAVASCERYLAGHSHAWRLEQEAETLLFDLMFARGTDHVALDPVRLLVMTMLRTARAQQSPRLPRWHDVMQALVELVNTPVTVPSEPVVRLHPGPPPADEDTRR